MTRLRPALPIRLAALAGCAAGRAQAWPPSAPPATVPGRDSAAAVGVEAPPAEPGNDAAADSLLMDVRAADRTVQVDVHIARRSRHNLGVAVDLTPVDPATGTEVPMGTPFDSFGPEAHTANATGRIARYRQVLVRAVAAEGFDAVPFDRVIR